MFERLQTWLRSHRGYVRFRHVQRTGVARWLRWQRWERLILRSAPVRTRPVGDPAAKCELHVMTWRGDWRLGLWAAKSFYHFAGVDWPLVVHDGGGLDAGIRRELARHFPAAEVVGWDEATARVEPTLSAAGHRHLAAARRKNVLMRKLIDMPALARTETVACFDADVLFFAPPAEFTRLAEAGTDRLWFNRDGYDQYSITPADAEAWFGLALPEQVNSGLWAVPRRAVDFAFLDGAFAPGRVPADRDVFPEQTAFALLAARSGLGYLPPEYEVAMGPAPAGALGGRLVFRHYVSPVREWMYDEGLAYLIRETRILSSG